MGQPHKHAALIKAWADNPQLELQFRGAGCQSNCWYPMSPTSPDWSASEVRIKPKMIKYRVALVNTGEYTYTITCNGDAHAQNVEASSFFIKWIGDWQEVEVS